jgi:hypothetical protein
MYQIYKIFRLNRSFSVPLKWLIRVRSYPKCGIFTTKLDFKNECLINHKTVFGTRNPAFGVGAVIAGGFCQLTWQIIVNIEFLCDCRVGCALRFLFFWGKRPVNYLLLPLKMLPNFVACVKLGIH